MRGEVRAAQTGYGLARKDAIIERVETGDQTKSVTEVLADVKETLKTPREKGDGKRGIDAVVTP